MEFIASNIPAAFRSPLIPRRLGYQPINAVTTIPTFTIGCVTVVIVSLALTILGLLLFFQKYLIPACLCLFAVPWVIGSYEWLKNKDWTSYCDSLCEICCCFRTDDQPVEEQPPQQQYRGRLPANQEAFLDSPIIQQPFPNFPTIQKECPKQSTTVQTLPMPLVPQNKFPEAVATQQENQDTLSTTQTIKNETSEHRESDIPRRSSVRPTDYGQSSISECTSS